MDFARLGNSTDNPFIESFNGSFRDECLNTNWLISLQNAKEKIEAWRMDYNHYSPYWSLEDRTPHGVFIEHIKKFILLRLMGGGHFGFKLHIVINDKGGKSWIFFLPKSTLITENHRKTKNFTTNHSQTGRGQGYIYNTLFDQLFIDGIRLISESRKT